MPKKRKIHPIDFKSESTDRPNTVKIEMVDAVKTRMENARIWLESRGWIFVTKELGYSAFWKKRKADGNGFLWSNDRSEIEPTERFSFEIFGYASDAIEYMKTGKIDKAVGSAFICGMIHGQSVSYFRVSDRNKKSKKGKAKTSDVEYRNAYNAAIRSGIRKPKPKDIIQKLPDIIVNMQHQQSHYRRIKELGLCSK